MKIPPFQRATALWVLGILSDEEIPSIAAEALATGADSGSLRELGGTSKFDADDVPRLFELALRELGIPDLSKEEALRVISSHLCEQMLNGEVRPYDGAKQLWRIIVQSEAPHGHELDPFIYAASEYEERPADREFFERAILDEARELLRRRRSETVSNSPGEQAE